MVAQALLPAIEIDPAGPVLGTVIWLHGLGADGHDFEGIVQQLGLPAELGLRFVLPHAPSRAVSINNGRVMPAWYDIRAGDMSQGEDAEGIQASAAQLMALVQRERDAGVESKKIVLAGFSQGGAIALHAGLRCAEPLAGIMALSTYLPLPERLIDEIHAANTNTPVYIAHGINDTVIPLQAAERAEQNLKKLNYPVQLHRYLMEHSVCAEEIQDIRGWLMEMTGS